MKIGSRTAAQGEGALRTVDIRLDSVAMAKLNGDLSRPRAAKLRGRMRGEETYGPLTAGHRRGRPPGDLKSTRKKVSL
jgi:hypothetical protein